MENSFSAQVGPSLASYLDQTFHPVDPVLAKIDGLYAKHQLRGVHLRPFDGLHLEVLTRLSRARVAVEIGTAGGYSGVCIARGLPADGILHTFEKDDRSLDVARRAFGIAGVENKIRCHAGEALEQLPLIETSIDLVFIDADKKSYPQYLEWAQTALRPGGVIIGDNTLGFGKVHATDYKSKAEADTLGGLKKFNQTLGNSRHFRCTLLPTSEGLTVAVKL